MSIHFISGKPGGGKTLYGVKLVVEELLFGTREIFTNIAFRVPELNDWIQRTYPDWMKGGCSEEGVSAVRSGIFRLRVLTDEETGKFWCYRPGGVRIKALKKEEWSRGEVPDYSGVRDDGVMYVIDEVHNFFGARQWAQTGQDVLFYLSQHRKLGDTVVCITQAVGNVDKQFRTVTQDFTFLRNLGKETFGKFRLPNVFVRRTFSSPPTDTSKPMETGTFRLDVSGLCSVYDSAAGVGIHGRGADKMERKSGRHLGWFFVGAAVLCVVLFVLAPRAIARVFERPMVSAVRKGQASVVPGRQVPEVLTNKADLVLSRGSGVSGPVAARVLTNAGWVTMWVVRSNVVTLGLSDGRVMHFPGDVAVEGVTAREVIVDGQRYARVHAEYSVSSVSVKVGRAGH